MSATFHPHRDPATREAELCGLGAAGRLRAYRRAELGAADVAIWCGLYPEEVPTVNGEFEWIAATLADLD